MPDPGVLGTSTELAKSLVGSAYALGTDFFAFGIVVAAAVLYGFYAGRDRLAVFMLALFPATLLYSVFPYADWIEKTFGSAPWVPIGLFLVLFVGCVIALGEMVSPNLGGALSGIPGLIIMGAAFGAAVIGIGTHVVPVSQVYHFSPAIMTLFSGSIPFFLSLLAPLAAMFVVR